MKVFFGVNVLVYDEQNGLVLCIKRAENDQYFGGMYAFPGGEINKGESLEEAAKREFLEETGYELESCSEPKISIVVPYGQIQFKAEIVEGTLGRQVTSNHDTDIAAVKWITVPEFIESLQVHKYPQSEIDKMYQYLARKRAGK